MTVDAIPPASPSRAGLGVASLSGFVVLGLPDGMLGVAWPNLRQHFHQPLDGLAPLLLAGLLGYLTVASTSGRGLRRLGTGTVLLSGAIVAAAGSAIFAVAPWWPAIVVAALLLGAAGGALDAALNTAVSLARRPRLMNLLHAAYGVGAALGPLLVTAALTARSSWRSAYGILMVLEVGLAGLWVRLRHSFPVVPRQPAPAGGSPLAESGPVGRDGGFRALLVLSLAVFFCYTGLELAVASWSASFLRGPGGLSAAAAGVGVFVYWISLTAGRLAAAGLGSRLSARSAVRLGVVGSIAGAALVWADLGAAVTVIALAVLGLGLGPIFPALVTLTPARLGAVAAASAVGWELAAAGVGGTALSALVGVVLQVAGLASFGALLVLLALGVGCLNLLVERVESPALIDDGRPV